MTRTLLTLFLLSMAVAKAQAQSDFPQAEKLSRGLVVLPSQEGTGCFLSWRLLRTDSPHTTFDILRDHEPLARNLSATSCYVDRQGRIESAYQLVTKVNGTAVDTTALVHSWSDIYTSIRLNRPSRFHTPNDCSVGDVDGDGEYELFVKWNPFNAKDNSHKGFTDKVFIDCYRMDGSQLWRIDLGLNIRAGAHYTQLLVYDFDGDGRAELICKTAPGSTDGTGNYVSAAATDSRIRLIDNTPDFRNGNGYILSGAEFLTVFDGQTGAALHTVYYTPNRAGGLGGEPSGVSKDFWGDSYGNRCDRYLACVAYLDGADHRPSAVLGRGYYTKAYLWALDFDGKELKTKWLHASVSPTRVELTRADGTQQSSIHQSSATSGSGSNTLYGNGNHNLSVGDVDGDGRDEIIYGSGAVDDDGHLLYATGYGHGDAIHLADLIPERPGLEVFQVHENRGLYSWDLHDAATGEILHKGGHPGVDNGRGLAADILASHFGYEFWSADDRCPRSASTASVVSRATPSINFRIYWDGDLQDELLNDKKIEKVNENNGVDCLLTLSNYGASTDCNGSKHTPCLQADLFGDWREEIVCYDMRDGCTLHIFSTNIPTPFSIPTLMHDHVYRMGTVWQNVAYNQPPHLGYYLPDFYTSAH